MPEPIPAGTNADQRTDRRIALLLRTGKLVSEDGEFLCILRDASAGGLKARLFHDLPKARRFMLELANGEQYPIELIWQNNGHAGFRFLDRPIDVLGVIDEPSQFSKRDIRLRLTLPIRLEVMGECREAVLQDLSQNGAQIEVSPGLAIGQRVMLEADGLSRLDSRVRWRRGAAHGLVFQRGFRLDELAGLIARLQLPSDAGQDCQTESG